MIALTLGRARPLGDQCPFFQYSVEDQGAFQPSHWILDAKEHALLKKVFLHDETQEPL